MQRRARSISIPSDPGKFAAFVARFMSHIVEDPDPPHCWLWKGTINPKRYPCFGMGGGKSVLAHRVSWLLFRGPIPEECEVDHLCREKVCVLPDHLEPVTGRENNRRSTSPTALNARKIRCIRGHALVGANLLTRPDGRRVCRACKRAGDRTRRKS
jgi:hypothetical protein